MKGLWWKIVGVGLVVYSIVGGLLNDVPALPILNETIRNLYFHVTMWFAMIIIMTVSLVNSIKYLDNGDPDNDRRANESANTGIYFGVMGLLTGSLWARYTWGTWWTYDVQLNGAAITMLLYLAYAILRNSMEDETKRARIAAVYNIFAFVMMVVFILILPKTTGADSLHPGKGGNPGFNVYDLNSTMRMIFYPAIVGWTLVGVWIMQLRVRTARLVEKLEER